jgi:tRNA(Arg) A34 adenosine deaminase TadA
MNDPTAFLRHAVDLALANVAAGGRPFGAVMVRAGAVIATGVNQIGVTNDPTSHAEMNAIRAGSQVLQSPSLADCHVYASGQPCPMCMAAMRMAGIASVTYAYSNEDGEPFGLSSASIYADLARPFAQQSMMIRHHPMAPDGQPALYRDWHSRQA